MTDSTSGALPGLRARSFTLSPANSTIGFSTKNLIGITAAGEFQDFRADIHIGATPADSIINTTVVMSSLNTKSKMRDRGLQKKKIFNSAAWPEMRFSSTSITAAGDAVTVTGHADRAGPDPPHHAGRRPSSATPGPCLISVRRPGRAGLGPKRDAANRESRCNSSWPRPGTSRPAPPCATSNPAARLSPRSPNSSTRPRAVTETERARALALPVKWSYRQVTSLLVRRL